MLAAVGLGLLAAVLSPEDEATRSPTRPGRVVLAAESLRPRGEDLASSSTGARVVLALAPAPRGTLDVSATLASHDEDQALARVLESAGSIELAGGTWLGWHHASASNRHERLWARALRQAHARGIEIRAVGAAASWIARWSPVPRVTIDKPAQVPNDSSLDVAVEGFGLFDGPLVGVIHSDTPTADRVIERAIAFGFRTVLLLQGPAEVEVDDVTRSARIRLAPGGLVAWVDLGAGTRTREHVRGARLTLPADGDVLDLRRGTLRDAQRASTDGDPLEAASTRRATELITGPSGTGAAPAWVVRLETARDERTSRSAAGGLSGLTLDLEVRRP